MPRSRVERKKRRENQILNISIVIVIVLIGVFAWQIFKPSSTEVGQDETEQHDESGLDENEEGTDPNEETTAGANEENGTNEDENGTEEEEEDTREEDEELDELDQVEDGEWEPVGTQQSGAYVHDFNKGSLNWLEKERALRYATGLSEDNMTVWFIGNGGSSHRVKGVVSDRENVDRPYEILMEFVEGEGWQPLEKKQLGSNPYR